MAEPWKTYSLPIKIHAFRTTIATGFFFFILKAIIDLKRRTIGTVTVNEFLVCSKKYKALSKTNIVK